MALSLSELRTGRRVIILFCIMVCGCFLLRFSHALSAQSVVQLTKYFTRTNLSAGLGHLPAEYFTEDHCGYGNTGAVQGSGTLRGRVYDAYTQQPIANAAVYVCGFGVGNAAQYRYEIHEVARATTDTNGLFALSGLPMSTNHGPLSYAVVISTAHSLQSAYEIRPITGLTITETTQLDVQLRPGGIVTGMVSDEYTNTPLTDVTVYANFNVPPMTARSRLLWLAATTNQNGQYSFNNLSTSEYGVFFAPADPAYVWEQYPGRANYFHDFFRERSGETIAVLAGATQTGRDASLQRYSLVEGVVTEADTQQPLSSVEVKIVPRQPELFLPFGERTYSTDAQGRVSAYLPTGTYTILYKPAPAAGYPCQYAFDPNNPDEYPQLVQIVQPATTAISMALQQPGRITGRVRYISGRPVPAATLSDGYLPDPQCNVFNSPYRINDDGTFELTDLVPRTYMLYATLPWGNGSHAHGFQKGLIPLQPGTTISGVEFIFPDPLYLPIIR
jgi:hypothetical protein